MIKTNENDKKIENLIYEVREKPVMLDSDLAKLYECTNGTKDINKAVRRNIERFPEEFMFKLTKEEYEELRFQNGTSNTRGGRRYNPNVFTEQGVAMLSSVLHSEKAINMSIKIINAFVSMRKYVSSNLLEQKYINNLVFEHDNKINLLEESLDKLDKKRKYNEIYFNGQIYDAYSKIQEIFRKAKNNLIIIDSYADSTILNIIKYINVKVKIVTKKKSILSKEEIEKYNEQYKNLKVYYDNTFHDRYFIIDNKEIFHCGASINRIGYKTFSITLISDIEICEELIKRVEEIIKDTH